MVWGRSYAFNLRSWKELSRNHCVIKLAINILSFLEVWSHCDNSSASTHWPLSWVSIEEVGRSVIVKYVVVICILLVVQCNLNDGLSEHIWRRRKTMNLGRVDDYRRDFTYILKHTKSVVVVCYHWVVSERVEISTLQQDLGAASVWTSVRDQFCDSWLRIVPIEQSVFGVLLVVERYGKWNRFFDDIWKWRNTNHVIWIDKCGGHWFSTECASSILIEIEEILSPHLHNSLSVLGAIAGIDGEYLGWLVESKRDGVCDIEEVACQTDSKWHNFRFSRCWTVITLQASFILKLN